MFFLVYKTTNTINGMFYVGSHKTLDKNDGYMGSGIRLCHAIKKHGKELFKKEILCECIDAQEMYAKEKELVVLGPMSYNLKEGGHGGWDAANKACTYEEHVRIGRLGARALYDKSTPEERSERSRIAGRKGGRARIDSQSSEERSRIAKLGGLVGGIVTQARRTPEERNRILQTMIAVNRKRTPEERSRIARIAGIASAIARRARIHK